MSERNTIFSPCRQFRYSLWRDWSGQLFSGDSRFEASFVQFIGLNPSTADETNDDPTIRRCIGYAKAWGFGALCMTNAFAFRATDPAVMLAHKNPIGISNDYWLTQVAQHAGIVIAAWGNYGAHLDRAAAICKLIPNLHCLKINEQTGQPAHPLYLKKTLTPILYETQSTQQ